MNERMKELLKVASRKFSELSSPFEIDVLSEYNVTLGECGDLSVTVSNAIDFFIKNYDLYIKQVEAELIKMIYEEHNKMEKVNETK